LLLGYYRYFFPLLVSEGKDLMKDGGVGIGFYGNDDDDGRRMHVGPPLRI